MASTSYVLKYRPDFPPRFGSIQDVRAHCHSFFPWYNVAHQHSSLGLRRVLKPGGQFLFIEHGRAAELRVRAWQDRLTPVWRRVAGGCHMNRPIDELIAGAGFPFVRIDRGSASGPKPLAYLYNGIAQRPD